MCYILTNYGKFYLTVSVQQYLKNFPVTFEALLFDY
jgi:hypothetical protein